MERQSIPRNQKWLFWLVLGTFSTFFAEVFAGSDMFPFFHLGGILLVVPLYTLHILVLGGIIYRYGRPTFSTLFFAGTLFGLYEAYITKVLWNPPWGATLSFGGVAVLETLLLVLFWHAWFSFIVPLGVVEMLGTGSQNVFFSLPKRLHTLLTHPRGLILLAIIGGLWQAVNSPAPEQSLLSGVVTTGFLGLLIFWWKRSSDGKNYALDDLLPTRRELRWLGVALGVLYLVTFITVNPERLPGLSGHLIIWILYGVFGTRFIRSLRQSRSENRTRLAAPAALRRLRGWVLPAAAFTLTTTVMQSVFLPIRNGVMLGLWAIGIIFGLMMLVRALKIVRKKEVLSAQPKFSRGI